MEQNEKFAAFEGLAVKTSAAVWAQWSGSLSRRGYSVEDAVQEGRAALLEILPKLDDSKFVHEQRVSYVKRTVRGKICNWCKAAARSGDHRERPPEPAGVDPDELLDLDAAMAQIDETTEDIVRTHIAGESFRSIAERHGISEAVARRIVEKGMARLRKLMGVKDS